SCLPLFLIFIAPPPTQIYTLSLHDALPICEILTGPWTGRSGAAAGRIPLAWSPSGQSCVTVRTDPDRSHQDARRWLVDWRMAREDRKSTRLNSSHRTISYAVFCLKKKKKQK